MTNPFDKEEYQIGNFLIKVDAFECYEPGESNCSGCSWCTWTEYEILIFDNKEEVCALRSTDEYISSTIFTLKKVLSSLSARDQKNG